MAEAARGLGLHPFRLPLGDQLSSAGGRDTVSGLQYL